MGLLSPAAERRPSRTLPSHETCTTFHCEGARTFPNRPRIRRDYPLNISISVSGGKETNEDSLSNGE
ncbi:hypothetical protein DPMN_043755 [Dreissena polymorpha]|uniref:Uncharacterized protein n=1 Tax=Dreissena polymorpha TaxID=45954 RepID=A0A9D4D2X7_DREPO|nr:hypothetical protein DPMN_043755 [Dreissena polymorpha]